MFDWQIPVFPFDSSSVTITTTVWIGVLITAFFNLRLGWTLSALVIPGYVAPLVIARPTTAVVILIESIITYGIAIWISESNRKHPYWSSLFGRDRFFLIVIISVLVRSLCDGWLFPAGGRWMVENYHFDLDYKNDLNSFGLIAVALIANYFWKPGLKAGLPCLLTSVGLTWAIVVWVLVPFTNFNIGSFHLLYEDISASMLASPKAYMIMLVTGWLASWINLRYAWDFNGILIPALVALLWASPERILISFLEAGLILAMGKMMLSMSMFRNIAMQGGRKLAFFFTVCFVFRFGLAHLLSHLAPELKVTDFFGLGYLLSTLIAIKIHDKKVALRMTKGVLQVSVVGAVAACLIGFAMDRFDLFNTKQDWSQKASFASAKVIKTDKSIAELFKEEKIRLYRDSGDARLEAVTDMQVETFHNALSSLQRINGNLEDAGNTKTLNDAARHLAEINYELLVIQGENILLRELEPFNARGWFVVSPSNVGQVSIVAPNAVAEKWCGEAALFLHQQLGGSSVAIFNAASHQKKGRPSSKRQLTFEKPFAETFASDNGLYVQAQRSTFPDDLQSDALTIRGGLPDTIDLPKLKNILSGFEFRWASSTASNSPTSGRTVSLVGHRPTAIGSKSVKRATIHLSDKSRRKMVGRSTIDATSKSSDHTDRLFLTSSLQTWLAGIQQNIVEAGTNQYTRPKEEELLFIDEAILQPLVALASDDFSASNLSTIIAINNEARSIGYCIEVIRDESSGDRFIALRERQSSTRRLGWGTVLFRFAMQEPWGVEIPRPGFELRSFEFGTSIFQRPGASLLLVAGAHPRANVDGSSDLTRSANRGNLLNLARHVIFREMGNRPWLMVQARSIQAPVTSDIVVATDAGDLGPELLSPAQKRLCDSFIADGMTIEFVDGRADVAGYELGVMLQAASAQVTENKEMMSLWVSPGLRSTFRQQNPNDNLNAQLRACGLESNFTTRNDVAKASGLAIDVKSIPGELREQLLEFSESHDVVKLYAIIKHFDDFRFERFFDAQTNSTLIAVLDKQRSVVALLNPRGVNLRSLQVDQIDNKNLHSFILSRAILLEVGE